MKTIEELRDMIGYAEITPTPANIDKILTICNNLLEHIERIDKANKRTADIASCLANGIQPD